MALLGTLPWNAGLIWYKLTGACATAATHDACPMPLLLLLQFSNSF
jgi:hypothetical protein